MANAGFFRGTSTEQDSRYFNQNKKLLAKLTFPKCFDQKVDLLKVNSEVINQWIAEKITELLGFEDEIVIAMTINLLEPKVDEPLDPRQIQLALAGFLTKDASCFMKELWELLLSAQDHPTGISPIILEKKKKELEKRAVESEKVREIIEKKKSREVAVGEVRDDADKNRPSRYRTRNRSSSNRRTSRSSHRSRARLSRRSYSTSSSSSNSSSSSSSSSRSSTGNRRKRRLQSRSRERYYSRNRRRRH